MKRQFPKTAIKFLMAFLFLMNINNSYSAEDQTNPNKEAETKEPEIFSSLHKHSLGLGLGQTFLMGGFDDSGEDGITVDLYYAYAASYSFDILLNFHYTKHDYLQQSVKLPGAALSFKAKFFQYDQFAPYILGGLGFYRPQAERLVDGVLQKTKSKITFGANLGTGIDLRLNQRFTIGILWHYHNPFDVKQDLGPDLEGSYSKLMITSMYTF